MTNKHIELPALPEVIQMGSRSAKDVMREYARTAVIADRASQQRVLAEQAVPVATRYNVERDGDDLMVCFDDHEKGEKCDYRRYVPAYRKAGAPTAMNREALIDLIAEHLSGTYHCHRVWNAWNVGTMSEGDFSEVNDSDTPAELADAILPMLASPPAPQEAQAELERLRAFKEMHTKMVSEWAGDLGEALGEPSEDFNPDALIELAKRVKSERDQALAAPVAQPATEQAEAPRASMATLRSVMSIIENKGWSGIRKAEEVFRLLATQPTASNAGERVDHTEHALEMVRQALTEFRQEDDYLVANDDEAIHTDTLKTIVRAALAALRASSPADRIEADEALMREMRENVIWAFGELNGIDVADDNNCMKATLAALGKIDTALRKRLGSSEQSP